MSGPLSRDELLLEEEALAIMFVADLKMDPDRHAVTLQVIDAVLNVVSTPLYVIKHLLDVDRPHLGMAQANPPILRFNTVIPVPRHASFPGGHAASATALAIVLDSIVCADGSQLHRLKAIEERIAKNRVLAGLHTDLDTKAGEQLGEAIGNWMVETGSRSDVDFPSWAVLFAEATAEWA